MSIAGLPPSFTGADPAAGRTTCGDSICRRTSTFAAALPPGYTRGVPRSNERAAPLAYRNLAFVDGDDGRPLRILAEYLEPLARLRRERIHDTIVFFGSARLKEGGPFGRYYADARELARGVTEWSMSLSSPQRFVVCSGGGGGIMEAANRGAADAGGRSLGMNIGTPRKRWPSSRRR
jgi:hypothetical protein